MNDQSILEDAARIKEEAGKILKLTDIENYLAKFGDVHLIGSYKYDVMLMKDIDFHVIVKDFSPDMVKEFFDYTVNTALFEYVIFHDKHTFNKQAAARYPTNVALDSYYFGLRLTHNSNEWQIGVNFITKPQEASVEIVKLFDNATDKQRIQILRYKKLLQDMQIKMSSAFIYRAVIEKNIDNRDDLFAYLRSLGYEIPA